MLLIAGVFLNIGLLFGQPDHWEPTGGPLGGVVRSLLIDGETTYAGTLQGGIFASTDFGDNWSRVGSTNPYEGFNGLARNSSGHLFAATTSGVRRSTDGGVTWDLFTGGLPAFPNLSSIVVKADGELLLSGGSGIYKSSDGEQWTASNTGLTSTFVRKLVIGPDGSVYAATSNGLFKSTDGGTSWAGIGPAATVSAILVESDNTLWAGGLGGLFRNPGSDWTMVRNGSILALASLPGGPVVAAGDDLLSISESDGATWTDYVIDPDARLSVRTLASWEGSLLAGTDTRGIYRSNNGGLTWERAWTGLDASIIHDMTSDGSGRLYAATPGGVARSFDGGNTWDLSLGQVGAESVFWVSNGTLLAGTTYDGIYRSLNGGAAWSPTDDKLMYLYMRSFAEAPNGHLFSGANAGLIYRSVDDGVTWDSVGIAGTNSEVSALAVASNGTVYAGWEQGVLRSTDDGATWQDASVGLPAGVESFDFLFLPVGDILLSSNKGVFRSSNGGDSWELSGPVALLGARDLDRGSDGTIYCAVRGGGVAISMDGGVTWLSLVGGLRSLDVTSVAIFPATGKNGANDQVFAGTRGAGVEKLAYSTVSVEDEVPISESGIRLGSNYPNPFRGATTFPVELARSEVVTLSVFDVLGRVVERLEPRRLQAGRNDVSVDLSSLPAGTYFYQVESGDVVTRGSMAKN